MTTPADPFATYLASPLGPANGAVAVTPSGPVALAVVDPHHPLARYVNPIAELIVDL